MYLKNKKVFIAGGTGMTGTGIIGHILEHYSGTALRASYHNTEPFLRDNVEYVRGDLVAPQDCASMLKGCDCAIMAAAYTANASTIHATPLNFINENLLMNVNFLKACHLENIKRVIFIGSATVYQDFEGSIKEEMLDFNKDPNAAYYGLGWAGRFTEKLCSFLHGSYGMEIIIVRAANIYGPYAKFDPKSSNFIPAIIRKAVDGDDPFEVWGRPEVTRDVIYVDDFAEAVVKMLDNDGIKFETFNVGTGEKTTVGDVVNWALKHAGHTPSRVTYDDGKPTTMKFRSLDCTNAQNLLGWQPKIKAEEGIRRTVEWWKNNKGWWKR
ncbi:MAG: NAD(P)-dependent oxidoreductase [Nitrospirae bacterium]|nr:NAD(P)-dependent oxidoreductase [Nitrospirota bacterium]